MGRRNIVFSILKLLTFKIAGAVLIVPNILFLGNVIKTGNTNSCFPIQTQSHLFCSGGIVTLASSVAVAYIGAWLIMSAIKDFHSERKNQFKKLVID